MYLNKCKPKTEEKRLFNEKINLLITAAGILNYQLCQTSQNNFTAFISTVLHSKNHSLHSSPTSLISHSVIKLKKIIIIHKITRVHLCKALLAATFSLPNITLNFICLYHITFHLLITHYFSLALITLLLFCLYHITFNLVLKFFSFEYICHGGAYKDFCLCSKSRQILTLHLFCKGFIAPHFWSHLPNWT